MPSVKDLLDAPYGLFVLVGDTGRRRLWEAVAQACDSLFLLGPLAEKPELAGPARVWLLECPLPDRAEGLREILRRDAHAVHAIGPADDVLLDRMTKAALSGCVAAVELPEGTLAEILDRLRGAVEPLALWSALREIDGPGGPWTPSPAAREAGVRGAPTAELLQ